MPSRWSRLRSVPRENASPWPYGRYSHSIANVMTLKAEKCDSGANQMNRMSWTVCKRSTRKVIRWVDVSIHFKVEAVIWYARHDMRSGIHSDEIAVICSTFFYCSKVPFRFERIDPEWNDFLLPWRTATQLVPNFRRNVSVELLSSFPVQWSRRFIWLAKCAEWALKWP